MEFGAKLDETCNGINYQDRTFMVAGYIKDYLNSPTVMDEIDDEKEPKKTPADFKNNRGYVDDDGYVWIYRDTVPDKHEKIPWFVVEASDDKYKLKFNPRRDEFDMEAFSIGKVGDISLKTIIDTTSDGPVEYDEDVLMSVARATAVVAPEIDVNDDFLKRIVKTVINEKHVNVKKYGTKVINGWQITNLINGLVGTTKTGPLVFLQWMELLDCDFKIIITDNGVDPNDPLKEKVIYNSITDKISIGEEKNDETNTDPNVARSVKI
jgi:hypothetical protein